MNTNHSVVRTLSFCILLFTVSLIFAGNGLAQTPRPKPTPAPKPSLEKKFFVNILKDQRAIWTSPFHLHGQDAKWLAPLGLTTAALIVTDRSTSDELVEHGINAKRVRISRDISWLGSMYATMGTAGILYLIGSATHNDHLRETGLLGAEALIDSGIVVNALKTASQRKRPTTEHSSGEFFEGGTAFPSGHAISAWSLATVIAQEYRHRPLVQVGAYGLATAVGISRYTGRNHFLSDVLVGSAVGYGIGRYVYYKHHDTSLAARNEKQNDSIVRSKLFPNIVPLYSPRAHVYGAMLAWNF